MATTTHACPGGCGTQVDRTRYACRPCWFRVPKDMRQAIYAAWHASDHSAHRAAMADAKVWLDAHPRVTGGA